MLDVVGGLFERIWFYYMFGLFGMVGGGVYYGGLWVEGLVWGEEIG